MKKILLFLLLLGSLSSFAQITKMGGMATRVNDSTTYVNSSAVTTAHSDGYADIWFSNSSNLFWVWDGVSAYVNWDPTASGSGGSLNTLAPNIQAGNYTAVPADTVQFIILDDASTQTLTIPEDDFPVGTVLYVVSTDADNNDLIAPENGSVNFTNPSGTLTLDQNLPVNLYQFAANEWFVWISSDGGGGGHVIEDESTPLAQKDTLSFTGPGVSVSNSGDKTVVNIPGAIDYSRNAVSNSAGTVTLDVNSLTIKNFDLTTTETGNFTLAFSNSTNLVQSKFTLRVTGTITVTMPSAVIMDIFEKSVGRWNDSTNVLTLTGITASPFIIEFYSDGTNIWCHASNRGL